jgi:hypothetical protein
MVVTLNNATQRKAIDSNEETHSLEKRKKIQTPNKKQPLYFMPLLL